MTINSKRIMFMVLILVLTAKSKAQTVYADVAPIFIANCTSCHHNGGIEFPLTSYNDLVGNSYSILEVIQSGYMPPWPPDANYKHYANERILSDFDKNILIDWINNGMIPGDTSLAPTIPTYGNAELNGVPDLILELPKFTSSSDAYDKYFCLNVPTNLTEDRYIRAFEFIPGNQALIHHAVITIDTTGTASDDTTGFCYNFQGQVNIGDFAPGMGPTVLPGVTPVKFGFKLKAGSTMSFQLHIPEGTMGQRDSSVLNLFFYPLNEPEIREMYFETMLQNWLFYVPANDSIVANAYFPYDDYYNPIPMSQDISLYSSFPHSHNTCTSIINYAYFEQDTIPLIKIPHWDFHWQGQYTFNNMVKLPVGYQLFSSHKFDNTINNPLTPDHNTPVYPGLFTTNEMLFDSYVYANYQTGDESVDIAAILANDPLFYPTNVDKADRTIAGINIFPNPFNSFTTIDFTLTTAQYVKISIFNLLGQEIATLSSGIKNSGLHSHQWNGRDKAGNKLSKGLYFYKIKAGNSIKTGGIEIE
jgi:FlgD Ig-like domain